METQKRLQLSNSSILVTGGTGTFGQEFVKQALVCNPDRIVVYSRNEYMQWLMKQEIKDTRVEYVIGDIRNKDALNKAMWGIDIVVHTAALKHVPTCEENISEAVSINVFGTWNVLRTAMENGVIKVLALSTDKAVHPINVYGATKLLMEKSVLKANTEGLLECSCARFGNFWESHGNFVSLARKQVANGEPVTITNLAMKRYWVKIKDAVRLSLHWLVVMDGGEVFISKMELKFLDEILNDVAPSAIMQITGNRKGEKLCEELYREDEKLIDKGEYYVVNHM